MITVAGLKLCRIVRNLLWAHRKEFRLDREPKYDLKHRKVRMDKIVNEHWKKSLLHKRRNEKKRAIVI